MRVTLACASWISILLLGIWAVHFADPHLVPIHAFEAPCLLVAAFTLLALATRLPRGKDRALRLGALCFVVAASCTQVLISSYQRWAVLNAQSPSAVDLGARFVVGYGDVEALEPLITRGLVGGVFVTGRNVRGKSIAEIRDEIRHLQAVRHAAGLPALIIATDQEGGLVARLSPPLPHMPPLASLVNDRDTAATTQALARAYGERQGRDLASLGITVNFSPVVDLLPTHEDNPLDFHSRIDRRAISGDPQTTARVALAYTRGLGQYGVRATLKHFPGLGRVATDTHHFSAALNTPVAQLQARDWVPFRAVAQRSDALIMLSHVVLTEIDSQDPVSFSAKAVSSVIRASWGHDGVLITDDLTMAAAYNRGLCGATVKALNAGVDLLLIAYDYEKYYESMYCAIRAHEQGRLALD